MIQTPPTEETTGALEGVTNILSSATDGTMASISDTQARAVEIFTNSQSLIIEYGMSFVNAIFILIVGWIIAGWAKKGVMRGLNKVKNFDNTLKPLIGNIVRYIILIFVFIAVLSKFGVQTASIIALLGAAGLAVGLALQGTLGNIASGVMLLILRPFHVGDFIDAGGTSGTVEEIGLFTSHLKTLDGLYLLVPNSSIWGSQIKNFTRNPVRRIDVAVGISYNDNITDAKAALQKMLDAEDRILKDPAPTVLVAELADSSVNLTVRFWCNRADFGTVKSDLTQATKETLDAGGFDIPFPQTVIHQASA